jgi:hypothetical protein
MDTEAVWVARRLHLWRLLQAEQQPPVAQLARLVGASEAWVRKWRPRLLAAEGDDMTVFLPRSRRRKTSPRQVTEALEAKILHLRQTLSEQYGRRVGARNILYHLQQDSDLKRTGSFIPRSHTTVHDVLLRYGRIPRPAPRVHVPREPAQPLQVWEMDFADIPTARSTSTDKRQHQVEVLDIIDTGTSIALETRVSDRFDAQWALICLVDVFTAVGLPRVLRFDRDPRFVASWSMEGFPSALMRFLLCLGIIPEVCPPHRPDLKPYAERFVRTQKEECIYVLRPPDVDSAQIALTNQRRFYNLERPNQAVTCGNQPPSIALGNEVPRLPQLPQMVDPDAWLGHYHRQAFRRRINANGSVRIGSHSYYIKRQLAGQTSVLILDAPRREFEAWVGQHRVKSRSIRGLYGGEMPLADYVEYMMAEARSEEKRLQARRRQQRRRA